MERDVLVLMRYIYIFLDCNKKQLFFSNFVTDLINHI